MKKQDQLPTSRFYNWIAKVFLTALPWERLKHNKAADQLFNDQVDRPVSSTPTFEEKRDRIEIEFVRQELNKRFARKATFFLVVLMILGMGIMTGFHRAGVYTHTKVVAHMEKVKAEKAEADRIAKAKELEAKRLAKIEADKQAHEKWLAEAPQREAAEKKRKEEEALAAKEAAEKAEADRIARLKKAMEQQKIAKVTLIKTEKENMVKALASVKAFYADLPAEIRKIKIQRFYFEKKKERRLNQQEISSIKAFVDLGYALPKEFTAWTDKLPNRLKKDDVRNFEVYVQRLALTEKKVKAGVEANISMPAADAKKHIAAIKKRQRTWGKDPEDFEILSRVLYQQGRMK